MATFSNNVRYALRIFARRKAFSAVVVFTLAVGIGSSTAIFSFVNSILLEPPPFADPGRLVIIESERSGEKGRISQREIQDIKEGTKAFTDVAGYNPGAQYNLTERGEPEEIPTTICSQNLFEVLGVSFVKGKAWPEEFDGRRSFGIVLTEELWRRKFNSDNNIANETITLDAYPEYIVFGVLPAGFDFPKSMMMYRSATWFDDQVIDRDFRDRIGIARLQGNVTIEEAKTQLENVAKDLADKFPETNGSISFTVMPLHEMYVGPIKPYLLLITIAVAMILIIACVNVSNLLLSAGAERDREVAVRTIMGAGRPSIIWQFLTESLILSLTGGVIGVTLASFFVYSFKNSLSQELPHWIQVSIDSRVMMFSLLLAIVTGVISGIVPALKIARFNLARLIKESRGSSGGVHRHRLRKSLVIAELTLSVVLLVSTLLLLKSFEALKRSELGFNPDKVLTFRIALPWRKYGKDPDIVRFYRQLLIELKRTPGVTEAAFNDNPPLSYAENNKSKEDADFTIEGQSFEEHKSNPFIKYQIVSPSYKDLLDIPLLKGRWITAFDDTTTTPVAVISKSLAEKVFKNEEALGKRIKFGKPDSESTFRTIIGVVDDVRHDDLRKSNSCQLYISCWQRNTPNQFILLKTEGPAMQSIQDINAAVARVDGEQSTYDIKLMQERIDEKLWQDNIISKIFTLFAIIAVVLAAIGIYSVMAYAISLRTKEFGVRRVLGAATGNIMGIVFKEVAVMASIGSGLGIFLALVAADSLSFILYGVKIWSVEIYGAVTLTSFFVATVAALLPAWRAIRINPVKALKNE